MMRMGRGAGGHGTVFVRCEEIVALGPIGKIEKVEPEGFTARA
jgi:hypothetical protein